MNYLDILFNFVVLGGIPILFAIMSISSKEEERIELMNRANGILMGELFFGVLYVWITTW